MVLGWGEGQFFGDRSCNKFRAENSANWTKPSFTFFTNSKVCYSGPHPRFCYLSQIICSIVYIFNDFPIQDVV